MARAWLLTLVAQSALAQISDPLQCVDQLIGSSNGGEIPNALMVKLSLTHVLGNVFSGATLPYGIAKAVADTNSDSNQGGFTTDNSNVTGFSNMHDSGTGGSPSLGDFALFPYASCVNDTVDGCVFPKRARAIPYINSSLIATPGYFSLTLQSGVSAAMTTAQHTSLFRFTFPPTATYGNTSSSPLVLVDLTDLSDSRQDNASISVDAATGRMTGNGRFLPSFGTGNYVAYFCADFSGSPIRDNGIFVNSRASADVKDLKISRSINNYPLPGGAFVRFTNSNPVTARVGLSFISSDQACSNAEAEIPSFDFEETHSAAVNAWRTKLSSINVSTTGVNNSILKNFYSGIYRTMVNPQNYTGNVPMVSADQMWFDSFYWCVPPY